jgi:Holliday junction resolvase-like predicted endonuclease
LGKGWRESSSRNRATLSGRQTIAAPRLRYIVDSFKGCLVFVEVRTKMGTDFGSPEESITPAKMYRLVAAVSRYRQTHGNLPQSWRIDVVAVELREGKPLRIELIENAAGEI